MPKKTDWALAAGLILGEGCLSIRKHKTRESAGSNTFITRIDVRMGDLGAVKWLVETFGGLYYEHRPQNSNKLSKKMGNWVLLGKPKIHAFCTGILPFCEESTEKLKQIECMLKFCSLEDRRVNRSKMLLKSAEKLAARIKALKPRNKIKSHQ